tara:strand:- start:182 stop:589 length:408 start_codon:yes stop_codon:yes gene_type:complete
MVAKKSNRPEIFQRLAEESIDTFEAGWRPFSILVVKDLHADGSKVWGATDFDKCTISVEEECDQETARETLLHEITHVILSTIGFGGYDKEEMGDEHPDGYVEPTNNEHLTLQVSRGILQMMRLNSALFRILNGE